MSDGMSEIYNPSLRYAREIRIIQLEAENAQLKAALEKAMADYAWMEEVLQGEIEELKAELAQCQQRLEKWESVEVLDMTIFNTTPLEMTAEFYHNAANVARQMEERWKQATQREARLREALTEIVEKCEDEDWEYMFGDIIARAKQALEEADT